MTTADWPALKAFILDGQGPDDHVRLAIRAYAALQADKPREFLLTVLVIYKALLKTKPQITAQLADI